MLNRFPNYGTLDLRVPPPESRIPVKKDLEQIYDDMRVVLVNMTSKEYTQAKMVAHMDVIRNGKDASENNRFIHFMEKKWDKLRSELIDSMGQIHSWQQDDWPYWDWPLGLSEYAWKTLKGYYFDGQSVKSLCLADLFDRELGKPEANRHKLYSLLFESTLVLTGHTGTGKSVLAHMMAKHICKNRGDFPTYYVTKSLDSLGIQTRDGNMKSFGCMIYDDCLMRTLQNTKLDKTAMLSLFHVQQGGSFNARYHDAILPKGVPKIMCQNHQALDDGTPVSWFEANNLPACDALMRGQPVNELLKYSQRDQAIARRMIIFSATDSLITQDYWEALQTSEYDAIMKTAALVAPDPPYQPGVPRSMPGITPPSKVEREQADDAEKARLNGLCPFNM
jgi:energy-coupling factor transporter ATP-binding protein EcfA2